jgi:hypothetical protein
MIADADRPFDMPELVGPVVIQLDVNPDFGIAQCTLCEWGWHTGLTNARRLARNHRDTYHPD